MKCSDPLQSDDLWVKVIDMLQHNWALVEEASGSAKVFFIDDSGGIFDDMSFTSAQAARSGLIHNGFRRYADDAELQSFVRPPLPPFRRRQHPNGRIYSSGQFWRVISP